MLKNLKCLIYIFRSFYIQTSHYAVLYYITYHSAHTAKHTNRAETMFFHSLQVHNTQGFTGYILDLINSDTAYFRSQTSVPCTAKTDIRNKKTMKSLEIKKSIRYFLKSRIQ